MRGTAHLPYHILHDPMFDDRLPFAYSFVIQLEARTMKFITIGDLRRRPGQIRNMLAREREVILTSNGKPIAILSTVTEDTLEESLAAVRRARCIAAVETLQRKSVKAGTDRFSSKEISAEIRAARKARHR